MIDSVPSPSRWSVYGFFAALAFVSLASAGLALWPAGRIVGLAGLVLSAPILNAAVLQFTRTSAPARLIVLFGWLAFFGCACTLVVLLVLKAHSDGEKIQPGFYQPMIVGLLLAGLATLAGLWCFTLGGRSWAAARLPFDPQSFPQTFALATAVAGCGVCLAPLIVLGRPPMLDVGDAAKMDDLSGSTLVVALVVQFAWLIAIVVVAAGWPMHRSAGAVLDRLGVGPLSGRAILVSLAVTAGLVVGVPVFLFAQRWLWTKLNWPTTDEDAFARMLDFARTWYAPLVMGASAGLAEELFVRGLLQPRLGILLPNLLFAALHAFQYHWDGVVGVFAIGYVCALVRRRYNTTASILVHGLYDIVVMYIFAFTRS
ncbi:MAG: CPBP family intramembrane metalloprotease [Gemmataceae bacterium]|nr:CPBP family intramembrane metalloprotease [Gemmataceae bacterium]